MTFRATKIPFILNVVLVFPNIHSTFLNSAFSGLSYTIRSSLCFNCAHTDWHFEGFPLQTTVGKHTLWDKCKRHNDIYEAHNIRNTWLLMTNRLKQARNMYNTFLILQSCNVGRWNATICLFNYDRSSLQDEN